MKENSAEVANYRHCPTSLLSSIRNNYVLCLSLAALRTCDHLLNGSGYRLFLNEVSDANNLCTPKPPQKIYKNFISGKRVTFVKNITRQANLFLKFEENPAMFSMYCKTQEKISYKIMAKYLSSVLTQLKYSRQNFSLIKQLRNILYSYQRIFGIWQLSELFFFILDVKNATRIVLDPNPAFYRSYRKQGPPELKGK